MVIWSTLRASVGCVIRCCGWFPSALCVCARLLCSGLCGFFWWSSTYSGLPQGMKKHKLLREDILPAMASNRKVQRLLNEFMDLLSEYETTEIIPEVKNSTRPFESLPTTDQTTSTPPTTDQTASAPSAADQTGSVQPAGDKMEFAPTLLDQVDSATPEKDGIEATVPALNDVNLDPPSDQSDRAPQVKEMDVS